MSVKLYPTIAQIREQLNTTPQPQPKEPIITGVNVPERIKQYEALLKNTPFVIFRTAQRIDNNPLDAGNLNISLLTPKILQVEYIKNNPAVKNTTTILFETTHWFIAAIMNLFAKIFPCCVQGAAEFYIKDGQTVDAAANGTTCYVRRAILQEALPKAGLERHAFQGTAVENTQRLEQAAYTHFRT